MEFKLWLESSDREVIDTLRELLGNVKDSNATLKILKPVAEKIVHEGKDYLLTFPDAGKTLLDWAGTVLNRDWEGFMRETLNLVKLAVSGTFLLGTTLPLIAVMSPGTAGGLKVVSYTLYSLYILARSSKSPLAGYFKSFIEKILPTRVRERQQGEERVKERKQELLHRRLEKYTS